MFCAYVGAVESVAMSDQEVADAAVAIGTWNADMVHILRQVRRTLKLWGAGGQGEFSQVAEALRVKVRAPSSRRNASSRRCCGRGCARAPRGGAMPVGKRRLTRTCDAC
jgi:hypothetical protein